MGEKNKQDGFSRRTFLKGTALSGAMGASLSEREATAKDRPDNAIGPEDATLQLKVNGELNTLQIDTDETLAEVLRDRLGLTGAKIGCDRGACGACTVLVDGIPRASCLTLALDTGNHHVETVEALASTAELTRIQQSFIEQDAMQCGYCIPGFIVSAEALIRRKPNANRTELESALSGNLCRCGSQPHIVNAIPQVLGGDETQ